MFGHTIDFDILFTSQGENMRSRVEAKLEYPAKNGTRGEVASGVLVAVGRVSCSFVFEAYGDLHISLSHQGKTFFEDTIPLVE